MDNLVGTLVYRITGDTSELNSSLNRSRDRVQRTGKSLEQLGIQAKRVAVRFIGAYLVKSLIDAASNLEELDNKFKVVFDGVEKKTNNWAAVYAKATNRGVTATKTFLATQQDIQTGFGASTNDAAKFSKAIMGVVNDLSSFANIGFEETSAAIQSGLAGQFRALRRLGVGLNVNIINQGKYAMSLKKTWDEMSNLERQEAILSGIMSQSKNAIGQTIDNWEDYNYQLGDAVRTSDSYINSSRGLKQKFEDLQGALGQALLPAVTSVIHVLSDGVDTFNELPGIIQAISVSLGILAISVKALSGPIGWTIGSITALITLFSYVKDQEQELTEVTDSLSNATKEYNSVVTKLNKETNSLSEADRILLNYKKELLAIEIQQNALNLSERYNDEINKIEALKDKLSGLKEDRENIQKWLEEAPGTLGLVNNLENATIGIQEAENELKNLSIKFNSSMVKIAKSAKDGLIDIEAYKDINIDFYNELHNTMQKLGSLGENNAKLFQRSQESFDKIRVLTSEYKTLLQDLYIEKNDKELEELKNAKDYEAYNKRKIDLIKQEQRVALEKLAVDSNLVKSSEKVTALTISDLTARLSRFQDTKKATVIINDITNEQLIAHNKEYNALIDEQNKEQADKELDRVNALKEAREKALVSIQTKLDQQTSLSRSNIVSELENLGKLTEAYSIREQARVESFNKELQEYELRKEAGRATEEELYKIKEYYANEEDRLKAEKIKKEQELEDKAVAESKQRWTNAISQITNFVQDMSGSISTIYKNMTDSQIAEIDRATQAKLQALGLADETQEEKLEKEYKEAVKKGDMKLAKEKLRQKEKLRLEKEADDQKKKLQREQAIRERSMNIFNATVSTASAIIKALVNPGGWAGLGLSAVAGALGAAQIAAISSAPLPSFDVGTGNVPEDMIANIHKGETIIPQPFAEDVRKGKISIGEGVSKTIVNIINNSSAKISANSSTNGDIEEIQVLVEDTINSGISEGKFDDSLEQNFGITRRGLNA